MKAYLDLLRDVYENGRIKTDRTGVGTKQLFGRMIRFDLSKGFPAVTTKRLAFNAVAGELLWMIQGSTNVEHLRKLTHGEGSSKMTIWDANFEAQGRALGYTNGYLGPVYGKQWRQFGNSRPVDQLQDVIDQIKANPDSRRLLVVAWNPEDLPIMALPPCHYAYQFEVYDGKLSLMWNQRSLDMALGAPFDIASYALLVHIVASICGLEVGELIMSVADVHIYLNHLEGVAEQLKRYPGPAPTLVMPEIKSLSDLRGLVASDFKLEHYFPQPSIKFEMAV
ncbi:thymidylate synthase [Aeromonas phage GomatiRiver_11]|nr:thymidylate synthase [Aeromonas phage AhFM11]WKW84190.1 thymidylate synthase [Aeromonas phage GomatiRiver_11]